MVLGWFDPHFNADTRMTSPEQYKTRKNKNIVFFVFLWLFFFVSKSGNLNNWHFPAKIEGPRGAWEIYQPTIVGLYGQY